MTLKWHYIYMFNKINSFLVVWHGFWLVWLWSHPCNVPSGSIHKCPCPCPCFFFKCILYLDKKFLNMKNAFLGMIWNCGHFKKWNIKSIKNFHAFKSSNLFKMINRKMLCIRETFNIFYNKLQKLSFKNSFAWKSHFCYTHKCNDKLSWFR
jgi:hypothetical protein